MKLPAVFLLLAAFALASPAQAQGGDAAGAEAAWAFTGHLAGVSDYVWRGVSQSRGKPALQVELAIEHASGFHAGVFASRVDFTATDDEDDGIGHELTPYLGWSGALGTGDAELELAIGRSMFPGARPGFEVDYTEFEARLKVAGWLDAGIAYSPDIFRLGARGLYYDIGAEWPLGVRGLVLKARLGYYDLDAAAGDSYYDYLLGVGATFGQVSAELAWTDTGSYGRPLAENLDEASQAGGRFVFSLAWEF